MKRKTTRVRPPDYVGARLCVDCGKIEPHAVTLDTLDRISRTDCLTCGRHNTTQEAT